MIPYRLLRFMLSLIVASVTIVLAPTSLHAAPPPGNPNGWSDGYVYANGIRIHYYRATPATGKTVIVIHIEGAAHNLHHDQLNRTVEVLKEFLGTL